MYKEDLIARALQQIKSEVQWRDTKWLEEWLWELKAEQLESYLGEEAPAVLETSRTVLEEILDSF